MGVRRDVPEGPVYVLVLRQRAREGPGAAAAQAEQRVVRRQHGAVVRHHLAVLVVRAVQ